MIATPQTYAKHIKILITDMNPNPPTDHLPKWQKGQPSANQYIVLPPSDA